MLAAILDTILGNGEIGVSLGGQRKPAQRCAIEPATALGTRGSIPAGLFEEPRGRSERPSPQRPPAGSGTHPAHRPVCVCPMRLSQKPGAGSALRSSRGAPGATLTHTWLAAVPSKGRKVRAKGNLRWV